MSKQPPPSAKASSFRPPPFKQKIIQSTQDALVANARTKSRDKGKGKGKERAIFGELADLLGQSKSLPGTIQVERFAEVRALELLALQNAIKSAAALGSTRTFQSLPRHLRRRAASHNPRRVPKRFRSRAAAEIQEGDNVAKMHRKRAKLRAKGNLRGESRTEQLLRRQQDKTWLPTHIWHAKRFHMVNLWSHRLVLTPTLKSFRPSYRAARKRAIVHDVSYFGIIELQGMRDDLLKLLGGMVVGRFAGSRFESGARMAQGLIYPYSSFPLDLIGPVEIIWKPEAPGDSERTIWLRLHPAIYTQVYTALTNTLSLPNFQQSASTSSVPNPLIQIRDLRSGIDGFEIIGPRAGRVLRRILRLCKSEIKEKHQFFESLQHADVAEVAPDAVIGLKVHDPRLIFPAPVLKNATPDGIGDGILKSHMTSQPSADLAESTIWDAEVREELSVPTFKKFDLDRRRHKGGIPGTPLRPTAQDARIPILLIQKSIQSASSPTSSFHGLTVLLPRGWSNYLLTSFVYAGCAVGGLAERRVQHREAGIPSFPEHYGDVCRSGTTWQANKATEEEVRWNRRPPGKRVQWGAVGTRSAWQPDWDVVTGTSTSEEELTNDANAVESHRENRSSRKMWLLTEPFLSHLHTIVNSPNPSNTLYSLLNAFRSQRSFPKLSLAAEELYTTALVHVQVEVEARGSPGDMAAIYAIDAKDRRKCLSARDKDGQWGRAGWEGSMLDDQKSELQKLGEIPADSSSIIGYTSTGNFSLSRGHGFAIGQITLKSYIALRRTAAAAAVVEGEEEEVWVKVKNRDGVISRLARIQLCA